MKYIDRKGNITIEENEQDKFLRHLYNDRGGRLCLKLLIRPFVSKAAGVLLNTRLSARFVPDFVKNNKIDLSIYEKQNFSSWNDFFIRRIRKEERPIDMRENILISPCDGKLSVHRISSDSRFSIKDISLMLKRESELILCTESFPSQGLIRMFSRISIGRSSFRMRLIKKSFHEEKFCFS